MQEVIQGLLISLGPDPVPQSINTFTMGELEVSVEADASAVTVSGADPDRGFTVRAATGPAIAGVSEFGAEFGDSVAPVSAEGDGNACGWPADEPLPAVLGRRRRCPDTAAAIGAPVLAESDFRAV